MSANDPPPYPGPQDHPAGQYDPYSGRPYPSRPYEPYATPAYESYQQPYQQPYAPYQQPYVYPYAPPPDDGTRGQAVGALVTNIVLTLLCCFPLGVAGIVVSAMAMSRAGDQPESAKRLVRWGWGLAIASVVLGVLVLAVLIAVSIADSEFN